jgi:hypothetical protein
LNFNIARLGWTRHVENQDLTPAGELTPAGRASLAYDEMLKFKT